MVNRHNYQWIKAHLKYLEEIRQLSYSSVRRYWFYLRHLLLWADEALFSDAPAIRPVFGLYLANVESQGNGVPLAPETVRKVIDASKRFFVWAKMECPSQFKSVSKSWIDALVPPRLDDPPPADHEFVTLEEAIQLATLEADEDDLALRRDRAGAAMLYLSGMRVGALGTLPIEAVDVKRREVRQWRSLGVKTKFRKSATTYLLPIPELLAVVEEWDALVRAQLPPKAMWHPPTDHSWGQQTLSADPPGRHRGETIGKRLRKLFARAGLEYRSPHKFRHGHAVYGLLHARDMADYKAVSTNLMHRNLNVTDEIYAPLAQDEVRQRIARLGQRSTSDISVDGEIAAFLRNLSDADLSTALIVMAERLAV
jgi:integrase